jgi:hypothetical protein
MNPDCHRQNVVVAVVILTAAGAVALFIVYASGAWTTGVLGYIAWSLTPYAILLGLHYVTCENRLGDFSVREAAWSLIGIALAGPFLYFDIIVLHPDAQGAIAILMVPILQCAGILVISGIALSYYYLQERRTDPVSVNGETVLANPILSLLNRSALVIFSLYVLISVLQYSDAKTIDTAKEVDFFINQYCAAHGMLPTSSRLHERFPGLTTDAGWFIFTDDVTWLKLQYPVKWSNSRALGKSQTSEFTATTYSYIIEYRCGGSR